MVDSNFALIDLFQQFTTEPGCLRAYQNDYVMNLL